MAMTYGGQLNAALRDAEAATNERNRFNELYRWEQDRARSLTKAMAVAVALLIFGLVSLAFAHDETTAVSKEQAEVYKMYSKWNRPKGNFPGIEHRKISCCNKMDCGVVQETRRHAGTGRLEVRVCTESEVCDPDRWYPVDPAIIEENQADPVESVDGRAHACVIGGVIACYVGGAGG